MKKLSLVIIFCTIWELNYGQSSKTSFTDLRRSIEYNMTLPEYLVEHCIPTSALIKISSDKTGKTDIDISDSAEPLLKIEFLSKIPKFNLGYIKRYCRENNVDRIVILIPLNFHTKDCIVQNVDSELINKFTFFNQHAFLGFAMVLEPIDIVASQPVR